MTNNTAAAIHRLEQTYWRIFLSGGTWNSISEFDMRDCRDRAGFRWHVRAHAFKSDRDLFANCTPHADSTPHHFIRGSGDTSVGYHQALA
jgi:hypothetical protein